MKLELWHPNWNPYSSWVVSDNTDYAVEIEDINIVSLDSLRLDGVSYTEQEGRVVGVDNIQYGKLRAFGDRLINNPVSSPITKFIAVRAIIRNDDDSVYIDGLILRDTLTYDVYHDKVSFSISDMLSVFIEWLDLINIEVTGENESYSPQLRIFRTSADVSSSFVWMSYTLLEFDSRPTFAKLMEIVSVNNQFETVIPNYDSDGTSQTLFEIQNSIYSTIQVENQVRQLNDQYYHYLTRDEDYGDSYPVITGIAVESETRFDIIILQIIKYKKSVNTGLVLRYMIRPVIYRFADGFLSEIVPPIDQETEYWDAPSGEWITQIEEGSLTVWDMQGPTYTSSGYQWLAGSFSPASDFIIIIKDLVQRNVLAPIVWTTTYGPTNFNVVHTTDRLEATLSVTNTVHTVYSSNGRPYDHNFTDVQFSIAGAFEYIDTSLKVGKYTMRQMLKEIAVSTDNFLWFKGGSVFRLESRSVVAESPILSIDNGNSSHVVKCLNLNANVSLSLTVLDEDRIDFENELERYYNNIINEQFPTQIDLNVGPTTQLNLADTISVNGRNYKIFGIDYYNGLYKLTLYGNGYTNG